MSISSTYADEGFYASYLFSLDRACKTPVMSVCICLILYLSLE